MQSSSMTIFKMSRQTQLVQLRSMATIKEKVGTYNSTYNIAEALPTHHSSSNARDAVSSTLLTCHQWDFGGRYQESCPRCSDCDL